MQDRNETQNRLAAEIRILPWWAWVLAAFAFSFTQVVFNVVIPNHQPHPPGPAARAGLGLLAGIVFAAYVLLVCYINRDAKRRGMSALLWTIMAAVIPNALGIILFFLLRQPLPAACPQCGCAIQAGFNFCPRCNYKLSPSCPQCQRIVRPGDVYCPYCGTPLHAPAPPPSSPPAGLPA